MTGSQEAGSAPIADPSVPARAAGAGAAFMENFGARMLPPMRLPLAEPSALDTDVAYVALGGVDARRQIDNLKSFGFRVSAHSDLTAGMDALANHGRAILVLHAEPPTLPLAVARLRSSLPAVWLIVAAEFPDKVSRIAAMLAGADTCTDASADSLELATTVMAASRRLTRESHQGGSGAHESAQTPSAAKPSKWQLTNHGWTLRSPEGTSIELNPTEREIMGELLGHPDEPLSRQDRYVSNGPDRRRVKRGMDVAISRLRKKAAEHSLQLPIKSVRGVGYIFVAESR